MIKFATSTFISNHTFQDKLRHNFPFSIVSNSSRYYSQVPNKRGCSFTIFKDFFHLFLFIRYYITVNRGTLLVFLRYGTVLHIEIPPQSRIFTTVSQFFIFNSIFFIYVLRVITVNLYIVKSMLQTCYTLQL